MAAKKRGLGTNDKRDDDANSDGFNTNSGVINLDQYLKNMRKEPSPKKTKRKMLSQGNDTFDEIGLELHDFHLKGKHSALKRAMSRKKREAATDRRPNGVEVGRYNPKFLEVDRKVPTNTFHQFSFLTDAEREKLLQEYEVETRKEEKLELSPNKRKKMAKSRLDRI